MADDNVQTKVIKVAGKQIPLGVWAIAKQLEAVLQSSELSSVQKLALAVNAGVEHNKKSTQRIDDDLRLLREQLFEAQDRVSKLQRSL